MPFTVLALILVAALCCSCAAPGLARPDADKLSGVIGSILKRYSIPGAAAGIRTATKKEWAGAKGEADVEGHVAMKPELKFRIGSNTKSFTAVVVLQLCDEKKLDLGDPLSKLLPQYSKWGSATVRQLLNMTSGIYNFTDDPVFWAAVERNPLRSYTPEQLAALASSHEVVAAPGEKWYYSNTNYILLGMIIEKISGRSAAQEVKSRIIDRLGLKNTEFATTPEMTGSYSHGYWDDPSTGKLSDITRISPTIAWTAGCMVSNIADLEVWLDALVGGTLLSKAAHKEQMTFVETGTPFMKYGLGVFEVNGYVGNGGAIPGYNSAMFKHPTRGDAVVCMFNKHPVDGGKAVAITDGLFGLLQVMAGL